MNAWLELLSLRKGGKTSRSPRDNSPDKSIDSGHGSDTSIDNVSFEKSGSAKPNMPVFTFTSIQEAFTFLSQGRDTDFPVAISPSACQELPPCLKEAQHIQVLCTGSLHLIGGTLRLLDPQLNEIA